MPDSIFEMSTPQKLNETAIFLPRNQGYVAIDLVSSLESVVHLALEYGFYDLLDLKRRPLERFLKIRQIPIDDKLPLIDRQRSIYDGRKGSVYVLSVDKRENGEEDPYHRLDVENLTSIYASDEEKIKSFREFMIRDPCKRVINQCKYRMPEKWIQFYSMLGLKSQSIVSVADKHGFDAIGYLTIFYDVEGLGGIGDINPTKLKLTKFFVTKQLSFKRRLDNYILGQTLTKTPLMNLLTKLAKKAYDVNLLNMV